MNVRNVEDKFNVDGIAATIIEEMKDHGTGADAFDDYWYRIRLDLNSREFDMAEIKILEGLVQQKVSKVLDDVF